MKIPEDVYETRCQYCLHGLPGAQNIEIPDDKLFYHNFAKNSPCQVIGIAQCDKVEGECLSFHPNPMFGICEYCAFNNSFHTGYCTFPGGAANKRRVYLGWRGGGFRDDYWGEHSLFTCDHYQVAATWKDLILRNALEGRAPANFDPDTWEPLERLDGTAAAKRWSELQAKQDAERSWQEKKRAEKAAQTCEKQLSIFEIEGVGGE